MRDFHFPGRSGVFAARGMCATSNPLAAREAVKIMEDGGNAMDAAIAAAVLLGLCEPAMTGIGGDMFALIKPAGSDDIKGFNASGRAPKALSAALLRDQGLSAVPVASAHAVTIPGAVDGFCRLSADWGKKGLAASLAPAIRYAEEGTPVGPRSGHDWAVDHPRLSGAGVRHFMKDGAPYVAGDLFKAPGQAEVLRRIAKDGRKAFYEGEVMEDMLASLDALGGLHDPDDFAATACEYVDPISAPYRGVELVELPPNGQGATALLLARILEQLDLAGLDPMGAQRAHLEAEATKLAYEARGRYIGDGATTDDIAHLLSDETAKGLAAMIDPARAMPTPPPGTGEIHRDTVYLTTADRDGMVVSMIYSIFHGFGSGLASSKFGILFQNRGAGFVLTEGHRNELKGGARPLHTIIPAMVKEDGKVTMSFGVMGGQYQCTGHARVLSNVVDYGMDPQSALDAARCFSDPFSGELQVEKGYGPEVRAELEALGHKLTQPETAIGGAQMIRISPDGVYEGASDPRKDGIALGY